MIWFKAGKMKSANWISQIGRIPYKAAPIPTPTIASSATGDSIGAYGDLRIKCTFGELDRLTALLPCPRIHLRHRLRRQVPLVQELRGKAIQRITRSPLRDFLPRTVGSVI